jgi:penicillin-binding protein 2
MTVDNPRLRLGVVAIVALSLFAALVARLWYLQVLSAPDFQVLAQANSVRTVEEPAPRGRILDRNGVVLVDNRASNVVAVDRSVVTDDEERAALLGRLAPVLGEPVEVLEKRLASQQVSPYTPAPVQEDVSEAVMTHLLERADEFPGVVAKRVAVRTYPHGSLAAHVLGYVGEVNDADLGEFPGAYDLGDPIGKAGVERVYEKHLRGQPGVLKIEVDAEGKPIRVTGRRAPVQGDDVVLSLDVEVQRTTEVALAEGLESARRQEFEDSGRHLVADAGAATVLSTDGVVVAMASYPTFDLPGLADGISIEEGKVLFGKESGAPFVNRAIQGRYAPGSTWKLVTADAALRRGLINPNYSLVDTGTYRIPGDCLNRGCLRRNAGTRAYGRVGVRKALSVSSDVFFYTLGGDFWIQRKQFGETPIQDVAGRYGFGSQTGIALPDESSGRVLSRKLKEELLRQYPNLYSPGWYTGDNVSLAIGQGAMTVTPIQIANAYAMFANADGVRYQPNLALRVQDQSGRVVEEIARRPLADRLDLDPAWRAPILQGLEDVVAHPDGTAYNAFGGFPLREYGVAGKTGTAQVPPKQDTALFVGFGPTVAPEYVVSVVMEQSGFGATTAAPVARRIFGTLSRLETAPARVEFTPANGVGD